MIPRHAARLVRARLQESPVVALVGPRQCGKTTLARALGGVYVDLEQEAERLVLDLEWDDYAHGRALLVLDEAQTMPEVFQRLRGAVDRDRRRNGRFLLLGSIAPALMTRVSQSLAGRLALVELTPLLLPELPVGATRDRLWLRGGFPDGGVLKPSRYPRWQVDFLTLIAQRDLPAWGLPARPQVTARLLRMLAAMHGQVWNASQLGRSIGLNDKTVSSYVEYLEGAFLIRLLRPFHTNIGKRLVRSPKVYWRDTGLLHALLNIPDRRSLLLHPSVGASWEGYCIEQTLGMLAARDRRCDPYWFRTSDGYEIDLVLDFGGERWAVEFKLSSSPSPGDLHRLDKTADMIGATHRYLVSNTRTSAGDGRRHSCDLTAFLRAVAQH
jgi:uncharacterized protein